MNERIKALAEQALFESDFVDEQNIKITMEMFAELIVLECASICYTSNFEDSDAHAQNILYEFNIDNCRLLR